MIDNLKWLFGIMNDPGRKNYRKWAFTCILANVVDLLSLALIIPVIDRIGESSGDSSAVILTFAMSAVMIFRGILDYLSEKLAGSFQFSFSRTLSGMMYRLFCDEDLLLHNNRPYAEVQQAVRSDSTICSGALVTAFRCLISGAVWLMYGLLLVLKTGISGISTVAALMLLMGFAIRRNKKRMALFGEKIRASRVRLDSLVSTSYGAYKELRIDSRRQNLLRRYEAAGQEGAELEAEYYTAKNMVRIAISTLVQAGIYFILACFLLLRAGSGTFISGIVTYIAVMAKIIPASAAIVASMNELNAAEAPFAKLRDNYRRYEELMKANRSREELRRKELTFNSGLSVNGLCFSYPNGKEVFRNASFEIPRGKKVAVIGPSGAGKTTLLDLLIGLLHPSAGSVRYDDYDLISSSDSEGPCSADLGAIVSYIPQVVYLYGTTVRGNIVFLKEDLPDEDERIADCLRCAEMYDEVMAMPQGLETVLGENGNVVSGGQRQRLALARALYKDFEILIMDEATAALDVDTEKAVMDTISRLRAGKTLLIVTHHRSLVEQCDIVYRIEDLGLVRIK